MRAPSRWALLAAACVAQSLLVGAAVWPQLSARVTGEVYELAVAPVDPIDPFRGAYVALSYPALEPPPTADRPLPSGTVFVPLRRTEGSSVWTGGAARQLRPADGPYLRCDSEGWRLDCGIGSLFASQDEARRLEVELADGAVARVRIDRRGNAALLGLQPEDADRREREPAG